MLNPNSKLFDLLSVLVEFVWSRSLRCSFLDQEKGQEMGTRKEIEARKEERTRG